MDSIGAEVGQKMRSAIKAKLMELDCYVDDELPDYIMVMVANKRTKSQMNEDLNLFLATKTSTFVNWLHIVLKKLKEVTVTNPEVYKKVLKRKSNDLSDDKISLKLKKDKANKKVKKETQYAILGLQDYKSEPSITDNLPVVANKLADNRKIFIGDNRGDNIGTPSNDKIVDDNFDIPLLSEVNESVSEQDLQDIEKKIRSVKSRLGLLVESDNEDESTPVKSENDEEQNESNCLANERQISILNNEIAQSENHEAEEEQSCKNSLSQNRDVELEKESLVYGPSLPQESARKHKRITYETSPEPSSVKSRLDWRSDKKRSSSGDRFRNRSPYSNGTGKRRSILDRLGKRMGSPERPRRSDFREGGERFLRGSLRDRDRSGRLSDRLGRDRRTKEFSKGRSRSRERSPVKGGILGRLGVQSKVALVKKSTTEMNSDNEDEKVIREVPSLIKVKPRELPSNVVQPNKNLLLKAVADAQRSVAQTPKVGKDIEAFSAYPPNNPSEKSIDLREDSSIDSKSESNGRSKVRNIIKKSSSRMRSRLYLSSDDYDSEDEYTPKPVRKVERCKYWPSCRQGDKCEFVHPTEACKMFPQCKFGEKCLFLHPKCKFGNDCTKRECHFTHSTAKSLRNPSVPSSSPNMQSCKFFPNCAFANCPFYHPKPCKYGKYCKNIAECNFSHAFVVHKKSMSWSK